MIDVTVRLKDGEVLGRFHHPARFAEHRISIKDRWYKIVEEQEKPHAQVLIVVPE